MRRTLLLVEDNPDDADILREVLAEPGSEPVRLVAVETLREGFAALDRAPIDLLLLDLSLPDSQGLETLTRALAHPALIPIIVLTGLDDAGLGVEAIQAGAQDYLVKGRVDGALLHPSMHSAIERHRLLAERTADAQVSAALVLVGEALLAGLLTRALLDRLCHVAAEVLGCDATSTWVFDQAADAYLPTAANTSAVREHLSALRVASVDLAPLTQDGAAEVAVHVVDASLRRRLPEPLMRMPAGVEDDVCLTLRRGGRVVGVHM
jgi:CheY-like chemotaxis protein